MRKVALCSQSYSDRRGSLILLEPQSRSGDETRQILSSFVPLTGLQSCNGGPYQIGPTAHTKTSIYRYLYQQYLVLFTMALRKKRVKGTEE